jgi:hypothetical protein
MGTLHGVLAELGIEAPFMHTDRDASDRHGARQGQGRNAQDSGSGASELHTRWVVDQMFLPQQGRSYEVAYGAIPYGEGDGAGTRHVIKRIRIDGPTAGDWHDLDAGRPLDPELHDYAVRAFRPLDPD